ncbi:MAG: precorrin-6y C5,15-methyltransferase (decarboxylating) subunit CbiE [Coriobacteriales bacterium]|nr:precorrin-6y C5,15-methyltransferase (decarboxylating) subunit CbiE [Coriobacteriales bacterium]
MVSKVFVIGMGMGNPKTLTIEAREALAESELVIGAPRLLEGLSDLAVRTVPLVSASAIAGLLEGSDVTVASVVMSGDVGFYSGATSLLPLLDKMRVEVLPGISTLSYFCARLKTTWQDVFAASAHGRLCDVAGIVQSHRRSFFLVGGTSSAEGVCSTLVERGLGEAHVFVGERLSYDDERIVQGTARQLAGMRFEPLAALLVENDAPLSPGVSSPWLPDDAFIRGNVPMTKEEVRELAVCKLRVHPTDIVWDIGAGTGSVTVELARAAWQGQVFAIERNDEALGLIQRNASAFGLTNVSVVPGMAPEALCKAPAPDRVFVGGSAGELEEILRTVIRANPAVRICVPAVTIETLSTMTSLALELGLVHVDITQVAISKARAVGNYHLMEANNPVYLICADGPATGDAQGGAHGDTC